MPDDEPAGDGAGRKRQEDAPVPGVPSPPAAPAPAAAPLIPPGPGGSAAAQAAVGVKSAAQLFEEARSKAQAFLQSSAAGKPVVDKYFGTKLPPVCKQLGCYVTDDGKFFYCINPNCHKDRKRETKYNRRRRALVYFFCPKCKSREIQLHLKINSYECLDCAYTWKQ